MISRVVRAEFHTRRSKPLQRAKPRSPQSSAVLHASSSASWTQSTRERIFPMRVEASASATMCQIASLPVLPFRRRVAQLLGTRTASIMYWRGSPERLTCLDVGQPRRALLFEGAASRSRWFAHAEPPQVPCTRRHRKTRPAHRPFATTAKPLRLQSRTALHRAPTEPRRPRREKPCGSGPHVRPRGAAGPRPLT